MTNTGCVITASTIISLLIDWPPPVNMNVTYLVHFYHRISTHITSLLMIPTCKHLTKALNQVNVWNLYLCSRWVPEGFKVFKKRKRFHDFPLCVVK